ncbi:hypothetical protein [Actinophytocola sp. NPDC049390]|uniref:hypothetical protein n=1 Tax=Actinophytocola sp. NPDC049390 TaxID=3363894 RepID=UPI0037A86A22
MIARAAHHADLEPVVPGDVLVSVSLSPYGDLVALWAAPESVNALGSRRPVTVRITTHGVLLLELTAVDAALATAHLMPGDTVLAIAARNAGEHNAIHYDADGSIVATAPLGDAIEHVATTRAGDVWVGYSDQGAPAGLRRFGKDLRPAWAYDSFVLHCYALNVTDHAVWTCYHTDFPVVRIENDRATTWRNPVRGVRALAVAGKRVGLFGGYDARDRLVLGTLDDGEFHPECEHHLTLPDGGPLPPAATVLGRGNELHVVTDDAWYRLDIA